MLAKTVHSLPSVTVWTDSTAVFVFKDKKVGVLKDGAYHLVEPDLIINSAELEKNFCGFKVIHYRESMAPERFKPL